MPSKRPAPTPLLSADPRKRTRSILRSCLRQPEAPSSPALVRAASQAEASAHEGPPVPSASSSSSRPVPPPPPTWYAAVHPRRAHAAHIPWEVKDQILEAYRHWYRTVPARLRRPGVCQDPHDCTADVPGQSPCRWFHDRRRFGPQVHLCQTSGHLHLCSRSWCRQQHAHRDVSVCRVTGAAYALNMVHQLDHDARADARPRRARGRMVVDTDGRRRTRFWVRAPVHRPRPGEAPRPPRRRRPVSRLADPHDRDATLTRRHLFRTQILAVPWRDDFVPTPEQVTTLELMVEDMWQLVIQSHAFGAHPYDATSHCALMLFRARQGFALPIPGDGDQEEDMVVLEHSALLQRYMPNPAHYRPVPTQRLTPRERFFMKLIETCPPAALRAHCQKILDRQKA